MPAGQDRPWLTIGEVTVRDQQDLPKAQESRRIWTENGTLTGIDLPAVTRPEAKLPLTLISHGHLRDLQVGWSQQTSISLENMTSIPGLELIAPAVHGEQTLYLWSKTPLRCGWLRPLTHQCALASIDIQGAPLPAGAANFDDLIALLDTEMADFTLQPGGALELTLHWQALTPINEDYTVFLHVLDPADRIVGQIDGWPVMGTYPTSQWPSGKTIEDRYRLPIAADATPGPYRLEIGWYLLGSMQRLNVLDEEGRPIDNRLLQEGLIVP